MNIDAERPDRENLLARIVISQTDFDAFFANQVGYLKSRLADKPESLVPQLAIMTLKESGERCLTIAVLMMPFNEEGEKRSVLLQMGRQCHSQREIPLAVALSCEACMAQPPKGVEPRHCDNKREVVLVGAKSIGNDFIKMVVIPVRRDAHNCMEAMEYLGPDDGIKTIRLPILDHFFLGFFDAVVYSALSEEKPGAPAPG